MTQLIAQWVAIGLILYAHKVSTLTTATQKEPASVRARFQRTMTPSHASNGDVARVVFISGFPRSGTSTIMSMVKASMNATVSPDQSRVFSLFEPCHPGDEVDGVVTQKGAVQSCMGLLGRLSTCNFKGVSQLWGWSNVHTTNHGASFDPNGASASCSSADLVVIKAMGAARQVDHDRLVQNMQPFMDGTPGLRVLTVVRDPRGIYASWKTTEPWPTILKDRDYPLLNELCETFSSNLQHKDSRVHPIVFEDLVKAPERTMRQVYQFLGLPFGKFQERWITQTFNSQEASLTGSVAYRDTHSDSDMETDKWRSQLSAAEAKAFLANPACRQVFKAYGYPM